MTVILIIIAVAFVLLMVGLAVAIPLLIRRGTRKLTSEVAGFTQGQSGADSIQQHSGQVAALEGMAAKVGIHIDLADALGTKVPGTGMTQPVQATMHIVGRSAQDARAMRAPCQIAYAIQAPGVPAFSGEQVFEISTNQWPEPGDTVPCVYDAGNPTHVDIDWSQVQTTGDKALGDAQSLASELNQPKPPGTP